MLGQELCLAFQKDSLYEVEGWDKEDIDLTDFSLAGEKITAFHPDIVINAVAYNAVDACEENDEEYAKALVLNRDIPRFLAEKSVEQNFLLVHYSTDAVFDGTLEEGKSDGGCAGGCCGGDCGGSDAGYAEDDMPNPLSRYGESKVLGEQAVLGIAKRYYIIRLSRLFGQPAKSTGAKKSFFSLMLEAAKTKDRVQAVQNEKSCFAYAPDLAQATKELIEHEDSFGIYHLPNSNGATWYDGVRELYRLMGVAIPIEPVTSDAFPRPAKRPAFSVLRNTKRPPLRSWQEALAEYCKEFYK